MNRLSHQVLNCDEKGWRDKVGMHVFVNQRQGMKVTAPVECALGSQTHSGLGLALCSVIANRATSLGTYPPIRGHVRGEQDGDVLVSGPGFCTWNLASGYKHLHKLLISPSS
jgi:hypothetical protein